MATSRKAKTAVKDKTNVPFESYVNAAAAEYDVTQETARNIIDRTIELMLMDFAKSGNLAVRISGFVTIHEDTIKAHTIPATEVNGNKETKVPAIQTLRFRLAGRVKKMLNKKKNAQLDYMLQNGEITEELNDAIHSKLTAIPDNLNEYYDLSEPDQYEQYADVA